LYSHNDQSPCENEVILGINEERRISTKAHPWLFLGLTLGLTWTLEILAAVLSASIPNWGVAVLHYMGGLMALVVAVGLTHLRHDRSFRRDFWWRIIDFRRTSFAWFAVIFLYVPVKSGLAALIDVTLGGVKELSWRH
jgi:hypothetical protein